RNLVEQFGAQARVIALAGQVEQAGAGTDAFKVEVGDGAGAGGDGSLRHRVDAFSFITKNVDAGPPTGGAAQARAAGAARPARRRGYATDRAGQTQVGR